MTQPALSCGEVTDAPPWACTHGFDRHGYWAELLIECGDLQPVLQRVRWIPNGQFIMGSPAREEGRIADEGPQHTVTIREGFWMFDTLVTQALYEHFMPNRSRFKNSKHPVEMVSWHDTEKFMKRVNNQYPSLTLTLPTEEQWEYAARAGNPAATYACKEYVIKGFRNAPALDEIAFYGGNSGVESELVGHVSSAGWLQKQYAHQIAGTHPVKGKKPNEFGLYDMLGLLWELTGTRYHYYHTPNGDSCEYVLRGGAFDSMAADVRAAVRWQATSDLRAYNIGFRCVVT